MITYTHSISDICPDQLTGFFVGWPNPPTPDRLLAIFKGSSQVVLAIDTNSNRVVGFANAISDGVLSAYIPLLEVLPEYQKKGIGSELVRRILEMLEEYYMVDVVCDENLCPFYERFGLKPLLAMSRRNFEKQSGREKLDE